MRDKMAENLDLDAIDVAAVAKDYVRAVLAAHEKGTGPETVEALQNAGRWEDLHTGPHNVKGSAILGTANSYLKETLREMLSSGEPLPHQAIADAGERHGSEFYFGAQSMYTSALRALSEENIPGAEQALEQYSELESTAQERASQERERKAHEQEMLREQRRWTALAGDTLTDYTALLEQFQPRMDAIDAMVKSRARQLNPPPLSKEQLTDDATWLLQAERTVETVRAELDMLQDRTKAAAKALYDASAGTPEADRVRAQLRSLQHGGAGLDSKKISGGHDALSYQSWEGRILPRGRSAEHDSPGS
jgi:hypothetical protein